MEIMRHSRASLEEIGMSLVAVAKIPAGCHVLAQRSEKETNPEQAATAFTPAARCAVHGDLQPLHFGTACLDCDPARTRERRSISPVGELGNGVDPAG